MATTERSAAIVIADAGPLIHLDELRCLELLWDFNRVLVPEAVWQEVEHHRPDALSRPDSRLERVSAPEATPHLSALSLSFTLHSGELEALELSTLYPDALFLTDDTAARLAAGSLNLRVHGTIGIVIRALRRRQRNRDEVVALLRAISQQTTLHIRPSLLAEIIRQVETYRP